MTKLLAGIRLQNKRVEDGTIIVGSALEATPDGMWLMDRMRRDDDNLRRENGIVWQLSREFSQRIDHAVLFGDDAEFVPRREDRDIWTTPQEFYEQELR